MDPALAQFGWTEEQWNRICSTVTEEAQKVRVAAQILPIVGPEDKSTLAIPRFTLAAQQPGAGIPWPTNKRLTVDSNPTLSVTTIAAYVPLRGHEVADPELNAAQTMFRRAANYVARLEDAVVFNGRGPGPHPYIVGPPTGIPAVYSVTTEALQFDDGVLTGGGTIVPIPNDVDEVSGLAVIKAVIAAIGRLEGAGQLGPFALALGQKLFDAVHDPSPNFVLPRDRILPLIQGPLVRATTGPEVMGALVSLSGNPVELSVASDISVQYLQTTVEPRYVFRLVERIALRIKESRAIAVFVATPKDNDTKTAEAKAAEGSERALLNKLKTDHGITITDYLGGLPRPLNNKKEDERKFVEALKKLKAKLVPAKAKEVTRELLQVLSEIQSALSVEPDPE